MTKNQIAYYDARERKRSNLANEGLTQLRDAETARANLARETETNRSNVARETETARANRAAETETNRANVARESETQRSNLARELETTRSDVARETETNRSNLANELQRSRELAETRRSHMANEALTSANIAEQTRSNLAREFETNRHNTSTEAATTRQQDLSFINEQRAQDVNKSIAESQNQNRLDVATLNSASNLAIQELKERGMNQRQAKQIVSDAINVLHDDIASLLGDQNAINQIRRLLLDWSWDHNR